MMNELIDTKTAARFLGVSKAFLERDRWDGPTIPFVKVGARAVRYELGALEKYIASRRKLPAVNESSCIGAKK